MSAEPQRHTLAVPESRGSQIWCRSDLGLKREKFYAAFYAIQVLQRQQQAGLSSITRRTNEKLIPSICKDIKIDVENSVENLFLDRLALLFARIKTDGTKTPANVTATCLVPRGPHWKVYIAKNDGLQSGNEASGESERAFAKKLQDWMDTGACNELPLEQQNYPETFPRGQEPMFIKMANFWQDRIQYYVKESQNAWAKIQRVEAKTKAESYFQQQDKEFSKERFHGDWNRAAELADYLQTRPVGVAITTEFLRTFYRFWTRDGRRDWHKPLKSEPTDAQNFRKSIRYMEMLGMPVSTWKACVSFRKLPNYQTLQLIPIEKPTFDESRLDKKSIIQTLQWWKRKHDLINISEPLKCLQRMSIEPELFFHCELQILTLLTQQYSEEGHYFIGCSKLSCESCWMILRSNEQFTTRGSHHKISANCAFPFPSHFDSIGRSMREMQSGWKRTLFTSSIDIRHLPFDDTDQNLTQVQTIAEELAMNLARSLELAVHSPDTNPYIVDWRIKPNQGSFANVFKASKRQQGSHHSTSWPEISYALKVMVITSPEKSKMIRNEIQCLRRLQNHPHDNILQLKEAFYMGNPPTVFLATQPYAPLSLEKFLTKTINYDHEGWYTPRQLEPWPKIFRECLKGLKFLHTREPQILHLDLKPQNILLWKIPDSRGRVEIRPVIADFGISTVFPIEDALPRQGTAAYMSPDSSPTVHSDVWSLGCCFAQISVLLFLGDKKLAELRQTVFSLDQPGFSKNLEKVRSMLDQIDAEKETDDDLKIFVEFREIVSEMLDTDVQVRATIEPVLYRLNELEMHMRVKRLNIPEILICTQDGYVRPIKGPNLPSINDILRTYESDATKRLSMTYTRFGSMLMHSTAPRLVYLVLSLDKKQIIKRQYKLPDTLTGSRRREIGSTPSQTQRSASPKLLTTQASLDDQMQRMWKLTFPDETATFWSSSFQIYKDFSTLSGVWAKADKSAGQTIRCCALEARYRFGSLFVMSIVLYLIPLWLLNPNERKVFGVLLFPLVIIGGLISCFR